MNNYQIENKQWWVERWLELLNSYRFKKRLERARLYAREGNVLSIEFEGEQVKAKVQGSESEPYQVELSLEPFSEEDWGYVIETLAQKALYSSQLLAGEMPPDIESVFISNGLNLFPFSLQDIKSRCSCPDKANPCKHIGAVYYQLGDRFSEEPFVLFQLRGRTKTDIIQSLRHFRENQVTKTKEELLTNIKGKSLEKDTFSLNYGKFWYYNEPLESSLVIITPNESRKTSKDILGNLPLNYGDSQIIKQYLDNVSETVTQGAMIATLQIDQPE